MYPFQYFQEIIKNKVDNLVFNNNPKELYDPIKYSLSTGGKRLRPALTLMACDMFSGNIEQAINPAIAYEIFHNFTLIHDDIMDNSYVRRNKLTVHNKWNNNIAILSGDAMVFKAYDFFLELDPKLLKKTITLFNNTAIEVCEGQQYDMNFETKDYVSIEEYLKMIKLKTSVLIAACLKTGAIIANTPDKNANLIYDFGINIGLAFQLQDDLLDVYGDFDVFGKKIGNDIVSNKKTFLLINAQKLAKSKMLDSLNYWLQLKNFNKIEKVTKITEIYNKLDIKKYTEKKIKWFFNQAIYSLNQINIEENRKTELLLFANNLIKRSF